MIVPPHSAAPPTPTAGPAPDPLREQAVKLEAFLFEEMMRASGSSMPGAKGSQFESFMLRAQAEAVAGAGQTGLADAIYRAMQRDLAA